MTERQNVEVDYCPKCRGVWLDRGELEKIIERAALGQHTPLQPPAFRERNSFDGRFDDDDDDHHPRRRGGWLREIFDF